MANYLPVLLVSLSTNAGNSTNPDDSELSTQPRAQVDYLSHDWQEEDVWRSWRNMTRQKKAIANGARLENASWRTWWKQRNKLGTVSPETLNWLKDSDVTWLYGPLHTALDWKPFPKDDSVAAAGTPTSTAPARPNSPSTSARPPHPAAYKPILKHRSISQLLTSDYPPSSPIFSPVESEEEQVDDDDDDNTATSTSTTTAPPPRPPLFHTKSDTHITRWGPNRAFRKESPPRVDPPGIYKHLQATQSGCSTYVSTSSNRLASSGSSSQHISAGGAIRSSLSQDSASSGSAGASSTERSHGAHKKKHISFNTFVEQCIAIEKPKKNASGYFGAIPEGAWAGARMGWVDDDGYEEDQEDSDDEPAPETPSSRWGADDTSSTGGARAIRSDSEDDDDDEEEEEDDAIEIRSTSSRSSTLRPKKKPSPRSQSKVSTTSSSSSTSTNTSASSASHSSTTDNTTPSPSGSISPTRRVSSSSNITRKTSSQSLYRRSSSSTYRPSYIRTPRPPPLVRRTSDNGYSHPGTVRSHSASQHVTIAPIAPTLLKTTPASSWMEMGGVGEDGSSLLGGISNGSGANGDDQFAGWAWGIGGKVGGEGGNVSGTDETITSDSGESSSSILPRRRSWAGDGFGVPSGLNPAALYAAQQNGFAPGAFGIGKGLISDDDAQGSDGTPVELVYVPPFEYDYDEEVFEEEDEVLLEEDEQREVEQTVFQHPTVTGSVGPTAASPIPIQGSGLPKVVVDAGTTSTSNMLSASKLNGRRALAVDVEEDREEDAYDYFGGPDLGDDYYYYARRGGRGYEYGASSTSGGRTRNASNQKFSPTTPSGNVSYAANARQIERQRERKKVGNGDERPSRSRSRSQSRTPSPAMMSSTSPTTSSSAIPRNGSNSSVGSIGGSGRKRSQSASSPTKNGMLTASNSSVNPPIGTSLGTLRHSTSQDLLSPPTRGRGLDSPSSPSSHGRLGGQPAVQDERRGRSSTRTSSSSSSWTERSGGSVGGGSSTSPMGSLSPDGTGARTNMNGVGLGIGAVLGSGRVVENDTGGRGRERRGRERTSSKVLGAATSNVSSPTTANGVPPPAHKQQPITDMTASMISTTSTSSSSSSTAVPPSTVAPSCVEDDDEDDEENAVTPSESPELMFMRRAEEDLRKRTQTPSNSPTVEMRMADMRHWANKATPGSSPGASAGSRTPTATSSTVSDSDILTSVDQSLSNTVKSDDTIPQNQRVPKVSPPRLRPPSTLIPTPPAPSKPKTSVFTAAVTPGPPSPGVSPGITPTNPHPTQVPSPIPHPQALGHHDATIVGKAVDIVSSAGAFLGLWGSIHSANASATNPGSEAPSSH